MKLKILLGVIVLMILISGCSSNIDTNTISEVDTNNENLRVAKIDLPGMFCLGCAQSSEAQFKGMQGVVDASVDIKTKTALVTYDSSIIPAEFLVQDGLIFAYDGKLLSDEKYE